MAPLLVPIQPPSEKGFKYQKLHFSAPPAKQGSSLLFIALGSRTRGRKKALFGGIMAPILGAMARAQIEVYS